MTDMIFVHGWAMGPDIWDPVIRLLPGLSCQSADLGFRGTPAKPEATAPFVVAHSLGLMWAITHLPRPWSGLIAIGGFTRFSRTETFPGVEPRLLGRMKSRLGNDPAAVVDEFLRRCGHPAPDTRHLDQELLAQGLDWLAEWDVRDRFARLDCPVLAVHGGADPIVTPDHARACFAHIPLVMLDGAGHLLPLTHADWLAARIRAAVKGDWSA